MPVIPDEETAKQFVAPKRSGPLYSSDDVNVIFVLGGPGAGKGTQCACLVREFEFKHLSAGDLLREEQDRPGSRFGDMIKEYLREGKIVPSEVTVQLLENAVRKGKEQEGRSWFLIDGFPRKMDQAQIFEETVCPSKVTLFFDCPEEVMRERLLNRGKTSGRVDDNEESIMKRFKTFIDTSMPVVDYYRKQGKVVEISTIPSKEKVHEEVKSKLKELGIDPPKRSDAATN